MKNKLHKTTNENILDSYEKELEEFLNAGVYKSSEDVNETKRMFEEAARRHSAFRQSKSITLRLGKEDLIRVKAKAKKNKIAYQTLIGLLIHQYVKGKTDVVL